MTDIQQQQRQNLRNAVLTIINSDDVRPVTHPVPNLSVAKCVICGSHVRPRHGVVWRTASGTRITRHDFDECLALQVLSDKQAASPEGQSITLVQGRLISRAEHIRRQDAVSAAAAAIDTRAEDRLREFGEERARQSRTRSPAAQGPVRYGPAQVPQGAAGTPETATQGVSGDAAADRPNRYAGPCTECRVEVAEQAGVIHRPAGDSRWKVRHRPGDPACQPGANPAPAVEWDSAPGKTPFVLFPGYYAVACVHDGQPHTLDFVRVTVPGPRKRWSGWTFIETVHGEQRKRVRGAEARRLADAIHADSLGAATRYGREIGKCWYCAKQLTDDDSRALGIGPVCRKQIERLTGRAYGIH